MQKMIILDETIKNQIENLARVTGKPEEKIVAEVLETGVRNYKAVSSQSAKAIGHKLSFF